MSGAHVYNFTIGVDNILNRFQPIYIGKCFDKQQFYLYQVYSLLLDSLLLCFSAILAEVISGTLGHSNGLFLPGIFKPAAFMVL